ncbi:MAG TPA: HDOD domain-containing protein [Candidatus Hydrogenedentes bacterium]|nr:HDOD domain-containing protein [Candidatus Hydrogenedentota bacterium]
MPKYRDIEEFLDEVVSLPSMPGVVNEVRRILDDPNGSIADAADKIALDPALTFKVLRLVNSAFYGLRQQVTSIRHAAALLGAKVLKNLCLTAAVFDTMKGSPERLIRHAAGTATAMRALAQEGPLGLLLPSPDEAFILGLVHDIGKMLLYAVVPDLTRDTEVMASERRIPLFRAEHELIGIDHAELGARLALHWKLDDLYVQAVGGHHETARCSSAFIPIASSITVADYIAGMCGHGVMDPVWFEIPDTVWTDSGVDGPCAIRVMSTYLNDLARIDELVGEVMGTDHHA